MLSNRPDHMSNAVYDFDHYPKCDPAAAQRRQTGQKKHQTPNVKSATLMTKAKATILTHQAGNCYGWREHCPQPPDVLFNGVHRLNKYKRRKGRIETSHRGKKPKRESDKPRRDLANNLELLGNGAVVLSSWLLNRGHRLSTRPLLFH
jgi:hypothetical protein